MEVELDTGKSAAKNASGLFDRAKKLRKKAARAKKVLKKMRKELEDVEVTEVEEKEVLKVRKKREWYEGFRWFFSSTGKLVIGGRDATSNEVLLKKRTEPGELVFHAEIRGAPFFVIKGEPDDATVGEAARAAGIFSKAWSQGYGSVSVYHAPREQFSKEAPSGEFIGKGAFMVYGEREWEKVALKARVGVKDGRVTCGPPGAIESWAEKSVGIEPGDKKPGEVTRQVSKKLGADPTEVQRALPAGRSRITKK